MLYRLDFAPEILPEAFENHIMFESFVPAQLQDSIMYAINFDLLSMSADFMHRRQFSSSVTAVVRR